MSEQPENALEETAENVAMVAGSARWLAALLGTETMPGGYTIAIFHESGRPIEHWTLGGRPVDGDNAGLLLATVQYTILHHQVAHFAGAASDEEWEAAMARVAELGDFDEDLTVAEMRAGRERIQAAKRDPASPLGALLAAQDNVGVAVIRGPDDLKRILATLGGEDGDTTGGSRAEAISHL